MYPKKQTRKYWRKYQNKLCKISETDSNIDVRTLIEDIVSKPHYDASRRGYRKYNEEIDFLFGKDP